MNCNHCHEREIDIASRKLCKKCYDWLRRHGRLDEYPKHDLYRDRLTKKYGKDIIRDFTNAGVVCSLSTLAIIHGFTRQNAAIIFEKLFGKKYSEIIKRR